MLNEIVHLAAQKKFQHLIVFSESRLSRHTEESLYLDYYFEKCGVKIHFINESENITTKDKKIADLIKVVFKSIAELEANLISTRTKLGNKQCAVEGYWPGGIPPLGYITINDPMDRNRSKIKIDPSKSYIINEVFKYYVSFGYNYEQVAIKMNEIHPRAKPWTKGSIESIITNEAYTGTIIWDRRGGRRRPGKHDKPYRNEYIKNPAIIDDNIWNKAVSMRSNKSDPQYYSSPYLLKNKLVCGICGQIMKTHNYGKTKGRAYRCTSTDNDSIDSISHLVIKNDAIESVFLEKLFTIIQNQDFNLLWEEYYEEYNASIADMSKALESNKKNTNKLEKDLVKVRNSISSAKDPIFKDQLIEFYLYVDKSIVYYTSEINYLSTKLNSFYRSKEELYNSFKSFCSDIDKLQISNKRVIVDLLIDKIIVHKGKSGYDLKIIINSSSNIK